VNPKQSKCGKATIKWICLICSPMLLGFLFCTFEGYGDGRQDRDAPERVLWFLMQHSALDVRTDPAAVVFVSPDNKLAFRYNVSNKVCTVCSRARHTFQREGARWKGFVLCPYLD
jgi:hypothetical protein